MKTLCIWHGGCDDGFASAWVVRKALGDEHVEFHGGVYQKPPPDVFGRDVLLVDFSYKRGVLEEMARDAASVTILDHHATAEADLKPLLEERLVRGEFDMKRCGAMITWDWFFPGDPPHDLLHYIQDRDLWQKKLPGCDQVIMALRSYPQDFLTWDLMMEKEIRELMDEGNAIHRYYRRLVDQAKFAASPMMVGGYLIPTVNVPHYLASEVAGELCREFNEQEWPFAAAYWFNKDRSVTFSLRSRDDFNVGSFAEEKFGGGGHPGAAGFRVEKLELVEEFPPEETPF